MSFAQQRDTSETDLQISYQLCLYIKKPQPKPNQIEKDWHEGEIKKVKVHTSFSIVSQAYYVVWKFYQVLLF